MFAHCAHAITLRERSGAAALAGATTYAKYTAPARRERQTGRAGWTDAPSRTMSATRPPRPNRARSRYDLQNVRPKISRSKAKSDSHATASPAWTRQRLLRTPRDATYVWPCTIPQCAYKKVKGSATHVSRDAAMWQPPASITLDFWPMMTVCGYTATTPRQVMNKDSGKIIEGAHAQRRAVPAPRRRQTQGRRRAGCGRTARTCAGSGRLCAACQ